MPDTLTDRTAKGIREALKGEGRVYVRRDSARWNIRVIGAREQKDRTQVHLATGPEAGWVDLLNGDDLLAC